MRVIYTSKGKSKKFGVRVIYRKILYVVWQKSVDVSSQEPTVSILEKMAVAVFPKCW
jgi:hypothetical protein